MTAHASLLFKSQSCVMNKAFVREPDANDALCPRCKAAGVAVTVHTMLQFVPAALQNQIGGSPFFCETPTCPVAYFDSLESVIVADDLVRKIFPKDPAAPICGCFGLTEEDVWQDIDDGVPTRIRALLQKSKTDTAQCTAKDPQGTCCMPRVQKLYFRLQNQRGKSR